VFGSIILILLGFLVNNGLSYDYRQQVEMEAFRRGLASAAATPLPNTPSSRTNVLIQDRHIPNPSDPFAIGSVTPMSAGGGVIRDYELHEVPANESTLPRMDIRIENSDDPNCPDETCSYTTSGFRTEYDVPQASLDRYHLIYGAPNVCDKPECGGDKGGLCLRYEDDVNYLIEGGARECAEYSQMTLRILDTCEGQIINRDDCTARAAQIVCREACQAECLKTAGKTCDEECNKPNSEECRECQKTGDRTVAKCKRICSQEMRIPGYADGTTCSGGRWVAPNIDNVLFAGIERMGVQPDSTQTVDTKNELTKQESPIAIISTTKIDLTETTTRNIVTRENPRESPQKVTATRHEESTTTWNAPW